MTWLDWLVFKHPVLVHMPVAVALLLPWALVAAQRPGRGIKPWWVTCRYLAWMGILFSFAAAASGVAAARSQGLLAPGAWLALDHPVLRIHQAAAVASLPLGLITLRLMFRRREEHLGLGFLPLFTGLLWCAALLTAGWYGARLHRNPVAPPIAQEAPVAPVPAPAAPATPGLAAPDLAWVLDPTALEPLDAEPRRSGPHGNRWVRVWATPEAAAAYRAGAPLPEGGRVVMSTLQDRWGRPGFELGPSYGLERQNGELRFTLHWSRVPEAQRAEVGGADRAVWTGDAPGLAACRTCHGEGFAPARDRSAWGIPKPKPKLTGTPAG